MGGRLTFTESTPAQGGLFDAEVTYQLRPPWWAVLSGNIAVVGVAVVEQRKREAAKAKRLGRITRTLQRSLGVEVEASVPLPTDSRTCDGPGICPLIRCKWNLLVEIRRTKHQDPAMETETISVGARGGTGRGASLAARRNMRGQVTLEDLDAVVDAVVERAEALPATCLWDYVRDPELIPRRNDSETFVDFPMRPHMTLEQIAEIKGVTREAVRLEELRALAMFRRAVGVEELDPEFVPASRLTEGRNG